jgi:hypothetical protein
MKALIDGFEQTGVADGERDCVGALDRPSHAMRKGQKAWWRQVSTEYDEWEPYCRACAVAYANQQY